MATLVRDPAGNLYGTTPYGGVESSGTVFRLAKTASGTWEETLLHGFTGGADGNGPWGGVIQDASGNLYGTTIGTNGTSPRGVVYKLAPESNAPWPLTVLYSFTGGTDGGGSVAGLLRDSEGNLYGTTEGGGCAGCAHGVVFKVEPAPSTPWHETVLHSFTGGNDGGYSAAGLIMDPEGNLYGTTQSDGKTEGGVVFKLTPTLIETVLHAFCAEPNCADGRAPVAGLVRDAAGNLYGTTLWGGTGAPGYGVVYKLEPGGNETVLYTFSGAQDGANPAAGLIMDSEGNLYGTTSAGGDPTCKCGTVFKLAP
jgi:uncharacterized repeat protein (TIGR03803 family)